MIIVVQFFLQGRRFYEFGNHNKKFALHEHIFFIPTIS